MAISPCQPKVLGPEFGNAGPSTKWIKDLHGCFWLMVGGQRVRARHQEHLLVFNRELTFCHYSEIYLPLYSPLLPSEVFLCDFLLDLVPFSHILCLKMTTLHKNVEFLYLVLPCAILHPCSSSVWHPYQGGFLAGTSKIFLSIRLHSKSHPKSCKCLNLLTGWHLEKYS